MKLAKPLKQVIASFFSFQQLKTCLTFSSIENLGNNNDSNELEKVPLQRSHDSDASIKIDENIYDVKILI